MNRNLSLAVCALLLAAAPISAGTLQIYESTLGAAGTTALFPTGSVLLADIDYDGSTAETGSLSTLYPPTEITILPFGDAVIVDFYCQLDDCTEDVDYTIMPGNAGAGGKIKVSYLGNPPQSVIVDLGIIQFESLVSGGLLLASDPEFAGSPPCYYHDGDDVEQTCDPFTLVQTVPEPGTGALFGVALGALAFVRRHRR